MNVLDVVPTTEVVVDKVRTVRYVHAKNADGSDGPWLGNVELVSPEPPATWIDKLREGKPPEARLWVIYPVSEQNQYAVDSLAVGYAVGVMSAAKLLRDYIADRNERSRDVEAAH